MDAPKLQANNLKRKHENEDNTEEIVQEMKRMRLDKEEPEINPRTDVKLLWSTLYAYDIYEYWRCIEKGDESMNSACAYPDWHTKRVLQLKFLVKGFNFSNSTLHLAIHILQQFLNSTPAYFDERIKTIISGFVIAAKFEEKRTAFLSLERVNELIWPNEKKMQFTAPEYALYEFRILRVINFELNIPTVATFGNYFSKHTVNLRDFQNNQTQLLNARADGEVEIGVKSGVALVLQHDLNLNSNEIIHFFFNLDDMLEFVNHLLFDFIDESCEILCLHNTLPSKIAASCVFATRRHFDFTPFWPKHLQLFTQYMEADLITIADHIVEFNSNKKLLFN